ncbi:MAG: hypothetical protein IJZ10_03730, partial [Thermoguttaceae bacterium]|nr:hypothetical protein [Thermoguttaceae bacterium]
AKNLRSKQRGLMCVPDAIEANMFTLVKNHVNGYFTDDACEGICGKENDYETPIMKIEKSGGNRRPVAQTGKRLLNAGATNDFERVSRARRDAAKGAAPVKRETPRNFNGGSPASASEKKERTTAISPETLAGLSADERKIVDLVGADPVPIDRVVRESGLGAAKIVGLIAALEFKKILCRREGNAVSRR